MEELITKIKTIQNKQQSLMWGSAELTPEEMLFAVGNKGYPRQPHFFLLKNDLSISILENDNTKTFIQKCEDSSSVTKCVIQLLKEWFPAKGQSTS